MIKVLFVIMITDGLVEKVVDLIRQSFRVTRPHGPEQSGPVPPLGAITKPLFNRGRKNLPDLGVRDHQRCFFLR